MPTKRNRPRPAARGAGGPATVLGPRALNRATLERQLLLARRRMPVLDALEHLIGLQAQAPNPPYLGLWTRLEGFRFDELTRLIQERRVVRCALMRGTLYLTTARDLLALRPLLQPVQERSLRSSSGRDLDGLDLQALASAGRALLDDRPRTSAELGQLLRERWPDRDAMVLARALRGLAPLVHVPPAGTWSSHKPPALATAETWLGRPLDPGLSPGEMILRYLAAYGPATAQDVATWSGMTAVSDEIELLRPRLRTFRDEHGRELLDLPDAPLPDPDTPAPPRLLPEFDNLLLSHADRARVLSEDHRKLVFTINGLVHATVLVDGFVRGTWRIQRERDTAILLIEPFARLRKQDRIALTDEGARVLSVAAEGARAHEIRFTVPERGGRPTR